MSDTVFDVRGFFCPLPVLKAARALRAMSPGERLRVLVSDRASVAEFRAFCRESGHALVAFTEEDGTYVFVIRRGEGSAGL
ncbi:sulfurtransferase TusA family protein [Acetobacter sp. AN02]|uniref:sulfurtransferase TusA family protein n=1 Tax=Acetobacter sp. AN02 TaxID=2894186 RepID=UPI002434555D|nr:sulfurtransferase TusA family protein [Acetobacter sp. AN02]MDG6095497.1 sulfurtransferase TusA family protein [Acetobacter sp. AN02]